MGERHATYVALLRGVNNVGAARRVAMADLRALFEGLGFRDVRTLLNSGNVVFSVRAKGRGDVRACIEKGLASRLGLTSPVTILSADEVTAAVRDNPLSRIATNPSHLLVLVPQAPSDSGGWSRFSRNGGRRRCLLSATASRISGARTASRRVRFGLQSTARLNGRARPETSPHSRKPRP